MKKILCVFAASVALCAASVPSVWAMPVDDTGDVVTPSVEALEPVDEVVDADTVIDVTDPSTGDRMTVDISEESIDAIAKAVNGASDYQYAVQYSFTDDRGVTRVIDTNETDLFNDFYIFGLIYSDTISTCSLFFSDVPVVFDYPSDYPNKVYVSTPIKRFAFHVNDSTISFDSFSSLATYNWSRYGEYDLAHMQKYIQWSNFHLYDVNDVLVYESSFIPPPPPVVYTLTFVTGIDGYTIDPVIGETPVPSVPSYEGYVFHGWFLDADFSTPYTSDYVFTADTTLYAKFEPLPEMAFFHGVIFDAFDVLFSCEPILYILALMFTVIIIGVIRKLVVTRC